MRNAEHFNRANANITVAGAKEINKLINEISCLLQLNNARIEASLCRGKWRGTFDYSLAYNDGSIHLVNTCNKRNKAEKTERVVDALTQALSQYKTLFANRVAVWEALREREQKDNARAAEMGLKTYTLKRIGITTKGSHNGWCYIILDIDGMERMHTETGLNYALIGCKFDELRSIREKYFPAGGYKEDDIDFIQGGVGFISGNSGYTVDCEGVTVIDEAAYQERGDYH